MDDRSQVPNYSDMIVIPFRIPPGMITPRTRQTTRSRPDRLPTDQSAGEPQDGQPAEQAFPVQSARDAPPPLASGRAPPAVELIVARVRGHDDLVVSGFSDGKLTLYRRDDDQPPRAIASFAADLDGSFWSADGEFLGRMVADEVALFHPDWLRSIEAGPVQFAGGAPDEGAEPANPAQRELEKEFRHLEEQIQPLGGAGPLSPTSGEQRPAVIVQPPIPVVPSPGAASRPGLAAPPRTVPLGFPDPESFASFGRQLYAGLTVAGYPDVYAAMRGSAATGESFRTRAPFDAGRRSDLDIALASPSLFERAKVLGIMLRSGDHRTQPLSPDQLVMLGLSSLAKTLQQQVGRKVSVMIYDSPMSIDERGANVPIPR